MLYARECAWCHGSRGGGTDRGPDLDGELDGGAYTHFMLSSGRMPISSPAADAVRTRPKLDEREIDLLVSLVDGFGGIGPDVPQPDISGVPASEGADLYLNNCAACHSSTGAGGALTSGEVAPPLTDPDITPVNIAEAILVGPGCSNDDPVCGPGSGAMPAFDFEDQEMNAIVAYVVHLQDQANPGGWALGRIGPVTEGAAAWLIGLGAMLVVARWIGTREGDES